MTRIRKVMFRGPQYIKYFIYLIFFYVIGFFVSIFSKKYKDVWIVSERGIDARDNGYHFYKYIKNNHPEINAYYIIDKNSADYDRVAELGSVVNYKSFKHHLLFAVSKYKISSHIFGYAPDLLCYNFFQKFGLIRGKIVFLQHGITKDDISWMFYPNTKLDLFVCGAKQEYEAICERYGYPEGIVRYLGLCRYDELFKKSNEEQKNQILLMPTWRVAFSNTNRVGSSKEQDDIDFMKTKYYRAINCFINDPELIKYLELNNLDLVFYPHIEMQKFLHTFTTSSKRVILASFKDYDVQQLLVESKLLITDFSSVFFDFAYMEKPIVFYQFDEIEYRVQNYAEGYFDYRRDGFGPVFNDSGDVVQYIKIIVNADFKVEDTYFDRQINFFQIRDSENCERNFNAIIDL